MVQSLGQVMLYVRDLDANAAFWREQAGFERVEKIVAADGSYVYVVAPLQTSEVQLVLQDKTKIEAQHPELHFGTPSLLMQTDDLEKVHRRFVAQGVHANPIVTMSGMKVFNFSDNEGNYFAIKEVKEGV